jgi:hypothetical protein
MTVPVTFRPNLTSTTTIPEDESLMIPYLTRQFEDISTAVNARDFNFFPMAIGPTAASIINMPTFGSYIICISGVGSGLPCLTASVCKNASTLAASIAALGSQAGTATNFVGATLSLTSTASNIQVALVGTTFTGNFNVRFIGTQS